MSRASLRYRSARPGANGHKGWKIRPLKGLYAVRSPQATMDYAPTVQQTNYFYGGLSPMVLVCEPLPPLPFSHSVAVSSQWHVGKSPALTGVTFVRSADLSWHGNQPTTKIFSESWFCLHFSSFCGEPRRDIVCSEQELDNIPALAVKSLHNKRATCPLHSDT